MLTGDKLETAENIGHLCNLITLTFKYSYKLFIITLIYNSTNSLIKSIALIILLIALTPYYKLNVIFW